MNPAQLRKRAEEMVSATDDDIRSMSPDDIRSLLHELNVHQVELSLQNDELSRTQGALQALYDQAPVGLFTIDARGIILNVNQTLLTMLGVERAQLVKKASISQIVEEDRPAFFRFRDLLLNGQSAEGIEVRLKRDEATPLWCSLTGARVREEDDLRLRIAVADMSERKRAEDLRNLVSRIFAALNRKASKREMARGVLGLLRGGLNADAVAIRLRGGDEYPYFQASGLPTEFLEAENTLCCRDNEGVPLRDDDGRIELVCMCGRVLNEKADPGRPYFTDYGSFFTNSTTRLVASFSEDEKKGLRARCHAEGYESIGLVPLRGCEAVIGLLQITSRKRDFFDSILISKLEEIGAGVGIAFAREEAEEARRAMEENYRQSQKLEAIGQLAGGVAHDYNNQLAGIMGYADLLSRKLEDPDLRRFAENILSASQRSSDLTRQLLAFARKGQYQRIPISLNHMTAEVADVLQHSIDKRIEVETQLLADCPCLYGDPSQIQNAILNLALNARDAMPDGGTLRLRTSLVEIGNKQCGNFIFCASSGRYICLSVSDTGCGMHSETLERAFEPFFTTKEPDKGTGMGLAAVYGTMKLYDGAIDVDSIPGEGTTVRLFFPLQTADGCRCESSVTETVPSRGAKILLVDDEPMVRELVEDMLIGCGHAVTAVATGAEGIEHYRRHHDEIDLVILDMVLPKITGREVYRELTRINPAVRVLLASGFSVEGEAQELLDLGVAGFIQKPFHLVDLVAKVEGVLPDRG